MESYEVLREAMNAVGVKSISSEMNLSSSLLYKWCQPKDTPAMGGADNPLDRLHKVFELTGDERIIGWLCEKADGYFVPNPNTSESTRGPLIKASQKIIKEFSDVLNAVSDSIESGGGIDEEEAKKIRQEWEELKSLAESFVATCEQGLYKK